MTVIHLPGLAACRQLAYAGAAEFHLGCGAGDPERDDLPGAGADHDGDADLLVAGMDEGLQLVHHHQARPVLRVRQEAGVMLAGLLRQQFNLPLHRAPAAAQVLGNAPHVRPAHGRLEDQSVQLRPVLLGCLSGNGGAEVAAAVPAPVAGRRVAVGLGLAVAVLHIEAPGGLCVVRAFRIRARRTRVLHASSSL